MAGRGVNGRRYLSLVLTAVIGLFAVPTVNAAAIEVTTTVPSPGANGDCTLGEAIKAANTDSAVDGCSGGYGADIIFLAARTFRLLTPYIEGGDNGLAITTDITLRAAPGPVGTAVIERDPVASLFRVLYISSSGALRLNGVTVSGGRVNGPGAGIFVDGGELVIENSAVSSNESLDADGGGIFSDGGSVTMTKSSVSNNTAANGGGISSNGGVVISNSTMSGNVANGNGGALANEGGTVVISNRTTVSSNNAAGDGGGIHNSGGTLSFLDGIVTKNSAGANGGGLFDSGNATIDTSTISKNGAGVNGGGIHNSAGPMTVRVVTLSRNSADSGGGAIFNAPGSGAVVVSNSAINDNLARDGAGIYNESRLGVVNSTFAGNTADNLGGGLFISSSAISNSFNSSTISVNAAQAGGGLFVVSPSAAELHNTILAKNSAPAGSDCNGTVVSLDHNLVQNPDSPCDIVLSANDVTGQAKLDNFTDDGEPGDGHFTPKPISPALERGNDGTCTPTDQIGIARIDMCEMGAIEFPESITSVGKIDFAAARFNLFFGPNNFNTDNFFFRLLLSKSPVEPFKQPFDKDLTVTLAFEVDSQFIEAYKIFIPAGTLPGANPRTGRPYTRYKFTGPPPVRKLIIQQPKEISVELIAVVERIELFDSFRSQLAPQEYFDTVLSKITGFKIDVQLGKTVWSGTGSAVSNIWKGRRMSLSWDQK